MIRFFLIAAALAVPAVPAAADPETVCGLEDGATTRVACPPYVTYDEDGEEVGSSR